MSDVTRVLSQIEFGDPSAAEQWWPLVYDAYGRLVNGEQAQHWDCVVRQYSTDARTGSSAIPSSSPPPRAPLPIGGPTANAYSSTGKNTSG